MFIWVQLETDAMLTVRSCALKCRV